MKKLLYVLSALISSYTFAQTAPSLSWNEQNIANLPRASFARSQIQELGGKLYFDGDQTEVTRYFTYAKIAVAPNTYVYGFLESANDDEHLALVSHAVFKTYLDGIYFYESRLNQTNETKRFAKYLTVFFSKSSSSLSINKKDQTRLYEFLKTTPLDLLAKKPPLAKRFKTGTLSTNEQLFSALSGGGGKVSGLSSSQYLPETDYNFSVVDVADVSHQISLKLGMQSSFSYSAIALFKRDKQQSALSIGGRLTLGKSTPLSTNVFSIGIVVGAGANQPFRNVSLEICPISSTNMRSILFADENSKFYSVPTNLGTSGYGPSTELSFTLPILGDKKDQPPLLFVKSVNQGTLFTEGPFRSDNMVDTYLNDQPSFIPKGYQFYSRSELAVTLYPIILKAFYEYMQSSFKIPIGTDADVRRTANASCSVIGVSGVYVFGTK